MNNEKEIFYFSKTPYAELHLHFGGSISPRILWHKFQADHNGVNGDDVADIPFEHEIDGKLFKFDDFTSFQRFFSEPKANLGEYLKMHAIAEPIQKIERIRYFIHRLMRGAYEFENLSYIELRHCPIARTDEKLPFRERVQLAKKIIRDMDEAIKLYSKKYPVIVKQIICLHSKYYKEDPKLNDALLDMAIEYKDKYVCGVDIAGGEYRYDCDKLIRQFDKAKSHGMRTTAHLFETEHCSTKLLDLIEHKLVDRIGHGILLPLEHPKYLKYLNENKKVCLEICPTTYFKCGTFPSHRDKKFKRVFEILDDHLVDIVIGTDNSGFHHVRLQEEFENLLIHEVITHQQMDKYRKNAFEHAFGLTPVQTKIFKEPQEMIFNYSDHSINITI